MIVLARLKAGERGGKLVEVADLLAAFIIEDQGGFVDAVSGGQGDLTLVVQNGPTPQKPFLTPEIAEALLARLEALSPRFQPIPTSAEIPLSQASKNALFRAHSLHNEMHPSRTEPLHLLAAILEHQNSKAARIFRDAGITREKVIAFIKGKH